MSIHTVYRRPRVEALDLAKRFASFVTGALNMYSDPEARQISVILYGSSADANAQDVGDVDILIIDKDRLLNDRDLVKATHLPDDSFVWAGLSWNDAVHCAPLVLEALLEDLADDGLCDAADVSYWKKRRIDLHIAPAEAIIGDDDAREYYLEAHRDPAFLDNVMSKMLVWNGADFVPCTKDELVERVHAMQAGLDPATYVPAL